MGQNLKVSNNGTTDWNTLVISKQQKTLTSHTFKLHCLYCFQITVIVAIVVTAIVSSSIVDLLLFLLPQPLLPPAARCVSKHVQKINTCTP